MNTVMCLLCLTVVLIDEQTPWAPMQAQQTTQGCNITKLGKNLGLEELSAEYCEANRGQPVVVSVKQPACTEFKKAVAITSTIDL